MSRRDPVVTKAYSLYARQIDQVRGYAIAMTDHNESAALRRIIDEWQQLKDNKKLNQQATQEPA